ncbi:MAG TPA: STAS domain-containing protein [Trebonia sp.]|jgi:anti-sigma B factor antagonist|nr:STAS domain-containing protein [Trebonia sp.]
MDMGSREYRGHVIVTLSGELDLVYAADVAAALRIIARRCPRIIADLADLEFIDCRGAAALVSGRWHARLAGGDLLLAAPPPRVRRVLAVNRPTSTFAVHSSVEAAGARAASPRGTAPGRTG